MSQGRSSVSSAVGWAVVVACVIVVLVASLVRPPSGLEADVAGVAVDKLLHGVAAAAIAVAVAAVRRAEGRELLVIAVAVVAVGGAIEGLQAGLPYRSVSLADAAANAVGALVGVLAWRLASSGTE